MTHGFYINNFWLYFKGKVYFDDEEVKWNAEMVSGLIVASGFQLGSFLGNFLPGVVPSACIGADAIWG